MNDNAHVEQKNWTQVRQGGMLKAFILQQLAIAKPVYESWNLLRNPLPSHFQGQAQGEAGHEST
jgi:hypothetical protein